MPEELERRETHITTETVGEQERMLPARRPGAAVTTREPRARELRMVRARADVFRARLEESREEFRLALARFSERTQELNPMNRVRSNPYRWVLGGLAAGLLLGMITAPRR